MTTTFEEWSHAIDSVVSESLNVSNVFDPPVDVFNVAEQLRMSILEDDDLEVRAKITDSVIYVRPDGREEREHFSLAHELGEYFAREIAERAGHESVVITAPLTEQIANMFATRLLLPNPWFSNSAWRSNFNLPELKSTYCTASNQVIGYRMLELEVPSVITIFDNGRITSRRGNCQHEKEPTLAERHVWKQVHKNSVALEMEDEGRRIQCWPIWEDDWKREIVRTSQLDW